MRLDGLDAAILRVLLHDARRSLRDVAREVASTPTTVAARLARMEAAGLVRGATLRLDAARTPGRVRLLEGRVDPAAEAAVLQLVAGLPGVVEAVVAKDRRLLVVAVVRDLDAEEALVEALAGAGAEGLAASTVRRATGPPPTDLFAAEAEVEEACAQCGRGVVDDALVETVDGRRVVFCCTSCRRLYLDRYAALKQAAERR